MPLGEKVKQAIERSGIPIRQVAQKIEMSEQNLYRSFKKNNLSALNLKKIADRVGLPIGLFFDETTAGVAEPTEPYQTRPNYDLLSGEAKTTELLQCREKLAGLERENQLLREMVELLKANRP